ncbi:MULTISPECIES: ABC transporter ATP-binding protein [Streptomyces]|uniref:ABC transporter ATP-binding protein n=1 Tax=Streptomyces TaxID=1883 RepID=UPI0001804372|nr:MULTISPECIES: ABC transporter ATP-binding protein [Streptomyces]
MEHSVLDVQDLHKRWGVVHALAGFDLAVASGEICGLMGHNGAGKTTFARVCAGLERPDRGRVVIDGIDLATAPGRARARVGLAPQEIALYPTVTLRRNLEFHGGLAGLRGKALRNAVEEITTAVELSGQLDQIVEHLSGGQQRRAQAATALLHRPAVMLLDEPTVGADPVTRQALLALVRARADEGAAVVYTTHYLPELEDLDATLAVAEAGRVLARGGRRELLAGLPGRIGIAFAGRAPDRLAERADETTADGGLWFTAARPAETLARLLGELGAEADRVRTVQISEPTLDDLYQHLLGAGRTADLPDRSGAELRDDPSPEEATHSHGH